MADEPVIDRTEYLAGVPCLIDTEQPDPEAAAEFYGGVFGWEFENKLPPGIDDKYLVASLHGLDVAAIASPSPGMTGAPTWNTYVSVVDADATTARAAALGAAVSSSHPSTPGRPAPSPAGGRRSSIPTAPTSGSGSPATATARSWSTHLARGTPATSSPATPAGAMAFYGALFGWQADPVDFGGGDADGDSFMWRLPGYGDFLAIRDPDIKRRHAEPWVPPGFSDAIGWMTAVAATSAVTALERHVLRRRHRRRRRTGG